MVAQAAASNPPASEFFERRIRPLFVDRCIRCHGPSKQEAGLRLDSRAGWQKGGESGPAILLGIPEKSRLIQAVRGADGVARMPPDQKLPNAEVDALVRWVKEGAHDPRDGGSAPPGKMTIDEARGWWSFQPVRRPPIPANGQEGPIDAFLAARLAERNLSFSPSADRRTLLRRATYDLTGLPPTTEQVEAFESDRSHGAFAKVVDRLLASPAYGERWGRHWLDLVRYADTAGENSDFPLLHVWRYRNWVINAFNRDQPYDAFLREQIAGDLLAKAGPRETYAPRVVATGFLALARRFEHDSDKAMHLTYEDGIDTVGKAFLGLTLGCARCHDHKYDAVSMRDYYALYGILASTRLSFPGCEAKPRSRDLVPLTPPQEWARVVKPYQDRIAGVENAVRVCADRQQRRAQDVQAKFVQIRRALSTGDCPDGGERRFNTGAMEVKAGELVLLSVTPLKNHGADSTLVEWEIQESGGRRRRWNITEDLVDAFLAGNPHSDRRSNPRIWWLLDVRNRPSLLPQAVQDADGKNGLHVWRNGDTPSVFVNANASPVAAWTKLPSRALFVHPAPDGNVAVGWLSPITGVVRISGRIKDVHPGGPDGVGWVLEHFAADLRADLFALADDAAQGRALEQEKTRLQQAAPKSDVAYAVGEGAPADAPLQLRGDPEKPSDRVPRRWLEMFGGQPIADKNESGRRDLSHWIASEDNPLTARVMVNRIWLQHFGRGLVDTPNDFGARGLRPTHPALLDWLAAEFIDSGWSVKTMHRTIMMSAAYQQESAAREEGLQADPGNDIYWRFNRRRLTAEELRDSLLAASSGLDLAPAGPHPFPAEPTWSFTQHTPFSTVYETNKRSVYLVQIRNRRHPFLGLFDGADPNATTPSRQTTTVPTQALYFMNDPFFHAQADRLAARILTAPTDRRLDCLFSIALQRPASAADRAQLEAFLHRYAAALSGAPESGMKKAWAALARVVLASNEFVFVE